MGRKRCRGGVFEGFDKCRPLHTDILQNIMTRANTTIAAVPQPNPIALNLKFASVTIIPTNLTSGNHIAQRYKLSGGEVVTLRYLCTWDNEKGRCDKELDKECRSLFGMDFASVESVWRRRLGTLTEFWHKVEMNLSE